MLQNVANSLCCFGWKNGHRGATCHPDSQLGDDEVRTVFGQKGNTRAGLESLCSQMRGHAPGLVHDLLPVVVPDLAKSNGLNEVQLVGCFCRVGIDMVEDEPGGAK